MKNSGEAPQCSSARPRPSNQSSVQTTWPRVSARSPAVTARLSCRFLKGLIMNIVVCLKQVPKKDSILRIAPDQKWIDERDLSYEMSEADAYALEEALRQKEQHGGEVIVLSLGPERVKQSIKEALAKGADRAIHLNDPSYERATDAPAIARALAAALKDEKFDLIFTGLQSDDYGYAQVGLIVAWLLDVA